MIEINSDNFEKEVLQSDKPVILYLAASWCSPCHLLGPVYEELSKEMSNIKFTKTDVDNNQRLAAKYEVMSIPTLIIFKDGKEINRLIGYMPKTSLKNTILSTLNN